MARLTDVPDWVRPPFAAVCATEDFLLWLWGQMKSAELLGAHASLAWLGAEDGEETRTPVTTRMGLPSEVLARTEMHVADRIAEAEPYPSLYWWEAQQVFEAEQMDPGEWATRIASGYERHFAHGVTVALGWLLGEFDDPAMMAPLRLHDGTPLTAEERERLKEALRDLSRRAMTPRAAG